MIVLLFLIITAAFVIELLFIPRLDYTREAGLLLWYNDIDAAGNRIRSFKKLI